MLFAWLRSWWRKTRQDIDLRVLWPICKNRAPNIELARAAFIRHMSMDSAWEGMTETELGEFVRTRLL